MVPFDEASNRSVIHKDRPRADHTTQLSLGRLRRRPVAGTNETGGRRWSEAFVSATKSGFFFLAANRRMASPTARKKQSDPADVEGMDKGLKAMSESQIGALECRIETVMAQEETSAIKVSLLRSIPRIGAISTAMPIAGMPELGRMSAGEAAAMSGVAPLRHDSGTMRASRTIAGGRRALRHVLYQAALLQPVTIRFSNRSRSASRRAANPTTSLLSPSRADSPPSRTQLSNQASPGRQS